MSNTLIEVSKRSSNDLIKITHLIPSKKSESAYKSSILSLISLYTNENYSADNIGQVTERQSLSYTYDSGGLVTVDVNFTLNTPFSGTYRESGAITNTGNIIFIAHIGTFTDSNGDNIRITVNQGSGFTVENLTQSYIYSSTTGKIRPI